MQTVVAEDSDCYSSLYFPSQKTNMADLECVLVTDQYSPNKLMTSPIISSSIRRHRKEAKMIYVRICFESRESQVKSGT